jgi:hypothetical protein
VRLGVVVLAALFEDGVGSWRWGWTRVCLDGLAIADHFEGVVHATPGEFAHLRQRAQRDGGVAVVNSLVWQPAELAHRSTDCVWLIDHLL